jgi:hypothetical protein
MKSLIAGHLEHIASKVFEALGREVATLVNGEKKAGMVNTVFAMPSMKSYV